MANNRKILLKPSGHGVGQAVAGEGGYYPLTGAVAFFRDDMGSVDADEWTADAGAGTSAAIFASAGQVVMQQPTTSSNVQLYTSVDKYRIPFRAMFAVSVNALATEGAVNLRVRDTGSTYIAQFALTGGSAGAQLMTGDVQVRAGSTAAGFIGSAAFVATAAPNLSATAYIMYVIDVNYSAVTFAQVTGAAAITVTTAATLGPAILAQVRSPVLKHDVPYVVEVQSLSGTDAGGGETTSAMFVRIDFISVQQYAPAAQFHQLGQLITPTTFSAGFGYLPWS